MATVNCSRSTENGTFVTVAKNLLVGSRVLAQSNRVFIVQKLLTNLGGHIHQLIVSFLAVHHKLQPRTPVLCQGINSWEHKAHLNFFTICVCSDFENYEIRIRSDNFFGHIWLTGKVICVWKILFTLDFR